MVRFATTCALILAVSGALSFPAMADTPAKKLFGVQKNASRQSPVALGSYAKGCLSGGAQLPESGPTWQAMRLSRNRNWGHPVLIDFIEDLSRKAARMKGWNGIYVGDLSQPRGGPMLTGHSSHQIGLDADVWLRPGKNLRMSGNDREKFSAISMRRQKGAFTNSNWTRAQHELVKAAAQDKRVARIFIFPGAKVAMCNAEKGDRAWLNKVRPWWGHHYHFHVRLKCPSGSKNCTDQAPPPPGDGCAAAQNWVDDILNPPPPDPNRKPAKKRPELVLADLPNQCRSVLSSR